MPVADPVASQSVSDPYPRNVPAFTYALAFLLTLFGGLLWMLTPQMSPEQSDWRFVTGFVLLALASYLVANRGAVVRVWIEARAGNDEPSIALMVSAVFALIFAVPYAMVAWTVFRLPSVLVGGNMVSVWIRQQGQQTIMWIALVALVILAAIPHALRLIEDVASQVEDEQNFLGVLAQFAFALSLLLAMSVTLWAYVDTTLNSYYNHEYRAALKLMAQSGLLLAIAISAAVVGWFYALSLRSRLREALEGKGA